MFVENALTIVRPGGYAAQIVPENLYNGANATAIRRALFDKFQWHLLVGCENAHEVWFTGIDTRMKFCIYSAKKGGKTESLSASFNVRNEKQLLEVASGRGITLPVALVEEFSPDAMAIMELSSQQDIDIASKMYSAWPKFGDEKAGPPHRHYMAEVHMGNDRDLFSEDSSGLPIYEGRMVDQFDHRAKAYHGGRGRAADWRELPFGSKEKRIAPQWFVKPAQVPEKLRDRIRRYRIVWCDVGSPTNERTLYAALVPPNTVCGDSAPTLMFDTAHEWCYMLWLAAANSFVMDFLARKKVSLHIKFYTLDSLPFPRLTRDDPRAKSLVRLGAELTCTGPEMHGYWQLLAKDGWLTSIENGTPIVGVVDTEQRLLHRARLDAIVAKDLFQLTRDELDYVLSTFPIVRRRDEESFGEFKTRRLVLEAYDHL